MSDEKARQVALCSPSRGESNVCSLAIEPLILSKKARESSDSSVVYRQASPLTHKNPLVFAKRQELFSAAPHVFPETCGALVSQREGN